MRFATLFECWGLEMLSGDDLLVLALGVALVLLIDALAQPIMCVIDSLIGWLLCNALLIFG